MLESKLFFYQQVERDSKELSRLQTTNSPLKNNNQTSDNVIFTKEFNENLSLDASSKMINLQIPNKPADSAVESKLKKEFQKDNKLARYMLRNRMLRMSMQHDKNKKTHSELLVTEKIGKNQENAKKSQT